jgi:hypothetical protein
VQPISLHVDECAFYVLIRKPAHYLEKEKDEVTRLQDMP